MSIGEASTTFPSVHVTPFLERMVEGKRTLTVDEGEAIRAQSGDSSAIYFIATGQIRIAVVSGSGKEAVLALLGPQECFLEESVVSRASRVRVATATAPTTLLRIERRAMLQAIQDEPELRERLMRALLLRNMAIEQDLCDQLFNQTERRLARALLKLARSRDHEVRRDAYIPALRHETLAEMVGTTRSHITRYMVKFRKMGLIDYSRRYVRDNPRLIVRTALLTDRILHQNFSRVENGSTVH